MTISQFEPKPTKDFSLQIVAKAYNIPAGSTSTSNDDDELENLCFEAIKNSCDRHEWDRLAPLASYLGRVKSAQGHSIIEFFSS